MTYEFKTTFYDTFGTFEVEANDYDEAYTKASDIIMDAIKDLPVEVEYDVDCVDEYEDE